MPVDSLDSNNLLFELCISVEKILSSKTYHPFVARKLILPMLNEMINEFNKAGKNSEKVKSCIKNLLGYCTADDIVEFSKWNWPKKICIFKNYTNHMIEQHLSTGKLSVMVNDVSYEITSPVKCYFEFIKLENNSIHLEGYHDAIGMPHPYKIFIEINDQIIEPQYLDQHPTPMWLEQNLYNRIWFSCTVPITKHSVPFYRCRILCRLESGEKIQSNINFHKFAPLCEINHSYYFNKDWLITFNKKALTLDIYPSTIIQRIKRELQYEYYLLTDKSRPARKAVFVRWILFFLKAFRKKEIWLLSDRIDQADDNGEVLFQYIQEKHLPHVRAYFVLAQNSVDYPRLRKIGSVIEPFSIKHKFMHLLSAYILSSQGNDTVVNPLKKSQRFYRDILQDSKFVFLQHGVTKDNQSAWLNKYNRNIYGLIATTKAEHQYFLQYSYYYQENNIWMTGMPRFDLLYRNEKNYITIMPTWRKSLMTNIDSIGKRTIKKDASDAEYFNFYRSLLNSDSLIMAAEEMGYQICFFPHPLMRPYIELFQPDQRVICWESDKKYRDIFAESNLIVTDYSSTAFDFAYLRKPILYCQFDKSEFFNGSHSYVEGYFNYLTDGFGKVVIDLDSTVSTLISYMNNGCKLEEEYQKRIDSTFEFRDQRCCSRIVSRILENEY